MQAFDIKTIRCLDSPKKPTHVNMLKPHMPTKSFLPFLAQGDCSNSFAFALCIILDSPLDAVIFLHVKQLYSTYAFRSKSEKILSAL